jgi:hypothetical protein
MENRTRQGCEDGARRYSPTCLTSLEAALSTPLSEAIMRQVRQAVILLSAAILIY